MENKEKVIQLDDRVPQLKERRKKKNHRRFIIYTVVFFVLILIVVYLQTPLSNIRKIEVKGNHLVSDKEVKKASGLSTDSKIWNLHRDAVIDDIKDIPAVAKAKVKRSLPFTVTVTVDEYQRMAYLKQKNAYIPILQNGTFLPGEKQTAIPADAPVLAGFKKSKDIEPLSDTLSNCPEGLLYAMSEIVPADSEEDPEAIKIFMNDGNVILADPETLADKIKSYPAIAAGIPGNKKGVINLLVGAYFEPFADDNNTGKEKETAK